MEILCADGQWRPWGTTMTPMGLFLQQPSTTLVFQPYLKRWIAASTNAFGGKELILCVTAKRLASLVRTVC